MRNDSQNSINKNLGRMAGGLLFLGLIQFFLVKPVVKQQLEKEMKEIKIRIQNLEEQLKKE